MRKADSGEDAVSVVIGAVLMLGIAITFLAILQTQAVPVWNEDTEFSHSQNVQEDIQSLGSAISFVSSSGTPRSVTVDMGTEYTDRVVLQNPPDASGTLRSIDGYMNISNAQVETSRETRDYWDGSEKPFETRILTYSPDYNRYQDAPSTVYGNSMVYNYWSGIADSQYNANLTLSEQSMINGRNINLVVLNGSISTGQVESKTVSLKPNSVMETTIAPTDDGDPITITVTSPLTAANWTSALQDEIDNGNVVDVSDTGKYNGLNKLEITLESDKTYNLRMAEVGIQQGREVPEYYLTDIEGNNTDGSQNLVAEVRDKYNNPVSGVTVNASVKQDEGNFSNGDNFTVKTSDASGQTTFDYTASDSTGTIEVNVSMDSNASKAGSNFQPRQKENVTFYLDITSGGDDGDGGNGGGDGTESASCVQGITDEGSGNTKTLRFSITNSGSCNSITVDQFSINSKNEADVLDFIQEFEYDRGEVEVTGDGTGYADANDEPGFDFNTDGTFYSFDSKPTIPSGGTSTFDMGYFNGDDNNKMKYDLNGDDITVILEFSDGSQKEVTFEVTNNNDIDW
ncbi:hypothetical protein ACEU6E_02755 [Halorutilales archaeon Cl-col2-1]